MANVVVDNIFGTGIPTEASGRANLEYALKVGAGGLIFGLAVWKKYPPAVWVWTTGWFTGATIGSAVPEAAAFSPTVAANVFFWYVLLQPTPLADDEPDNTAFVASQIAKSRAAQTQRQYGIGAVQVISLHGSIRFVMTPAWRIDP